MIDWNDFQYIMALHDGGTMKQAAELLKADPTTVSRHIKRISDQFGSVLFTMTKGGKWEITPQGMKLLKIGEEIKSKIQTLEDVGPQLDESEAVKVSSLEFLLTHHLAPYVDQLMATRPNLQLSLVGTDKRLSLAYGETDIAFRFGRPVEGQLIASKIADVPFSVWARDGKRGEDWVGLQEDLDWTPEMQLGYKTFGKPPIMRTSSFSACMRAARSLDVPFIAPAAIVRACPGTKKVAGTEAVYREVWSIIHETRRNSEVLADVRSWAKAAITGLNDLYNEEVKLKSSG